MFKVCWWIRPYNLCNQKHPHLKIYVQINLIMIWANVFVEVSGYDFITYLNQTITTDWCEIECESKSKHQNKCGEKIKVQHIQYAYSWSLEDVVEILYSWIEKHKGVAWIVLHLDEQSSMNLRD